VDYSSAIKFRVSCGQGTGYVQSVRIADRISKDVWERSSDVEKREYIQHWLHSWALNLVKTKYELDEAEDPNFGLMMYKTF
jgi:hypothetical protein